VYLQSTISDSHKSLLIDVFNAVWATVPEKTRTPRLALRLMIAMIDNTQTGQMLPLEVMSHAQTEVWCAETEVWCAEAESWKRQVTYH
jgi:hypothetical protein